MSMHSFLKTLFAATVASLFTVAMIGCCCGGGSETDFSDLDLGDLTTETVETGGETGGEAASGGGGVKSCNSVKGLSSCSEHQGKAFEILGEDFYKGICELTDGTWGADKCPADNQLGACDDGEGSVTYYYSSGTFAYSAETAAEACKDILGTWKAN